jgi:hypothetical protein
MAGEVLEASPGGVRARSHPGNTIMVAGKTDEWNGFVSVVARDVTADLESIAEEA